MRNVFKSASVRVKASNDVEGLTDILLCKKVLLRSPVVHSVDGLLEESTWMKIGMARQLAWLATPKGEKGYYRCLSSPINTLQFADVPYPLVPGSGFRRGYSATSCS